MECMKIIFFYRLLDFCISRKFFTTEETKIIGSTWQQIKGIEKKSI